MIEVYKPEEIAKMEKRIKELEKALLMINGALTEGLTIEKADPIHKKIIELLTK